MPSRLLSPGDAPMLTGSMAEQPQQRMAFTCRLHSPAEAAQAGALRCGCPPTSSKMLSSWLLKVGEMTTGTRGLSLKPRGRASPRSSPSTWAAAAA